MPEIVTDYAVTYPWKAYKNGDNSFTITLLENGSAFDISDYTFTLNVRTPYGVINRLQLTEGSGITNGGATGVITIEMTETQAGTTLPRDYYFWELSYEFGGLTYRMISGGLTLSTDVNTSTSVAISRDISLAGTAVTANITLAASIAGLNAHLADTDNPHEVTSEQVKAGVNVDDYGAEGDGTTDDTDAINDAFVAAGNNGIIKFTYGKTYLISNPIVFYPGQTLIGYGAVVKRCNEVKTTISANAAEDTTSITVTDPSVFAVDDVVNILDGGGEYDGAGHNEGSGMGLGGTSRITAINGSVLTISQGLMLPGSGRLDAQGYFPSGSVIVKVFPMFEPSGAISSAGRVNFFGLEFDGNKANNTATFSWVVNIIIAYPRRSSTFKDCIFRNTACECLNLNSSSIVENCQFYDLQGSAIHIGVISDDEDADVGSNRIVNNIFRRTNSLGTRTYSHSEGVVTVSAQVKKTFISGNVVETGGTAFYGIIGASSSQPVAEAFLYNNRCYDMVGIVRSSGNTGSVNNTLQIVGNTFDNCRWLWLSREALGGTKVEEGLGMNRVIISDNIFTNTKLNINDTTNIIISNNTLEVKSGHTFENDFFLVEGIETNYLALIELSECAEFQITGNLLINRATTEDARLLNAIVVSPQAGTVDVIKTDASTSTEYCYHNRFGKVNGNTVVNFQRGILDMTPTVNLGRHAYDHVRNFSYLGMEIKNNLVQIAPVSSGDATKYYGILCSPGTECMGNTVIGSPLATCGIYVIGVNDGAGSAYSGTARSRLNGPIVKNNKVLGSNVSIIVGNTGGTTVGHNIYNAHVYDNYVDGTVTDRTSGNSTISGTVSLINDTVPIKLLRQDTNFY